MKPRLIAAVALAAAMGLASAAQAVTFTLAGGDAPSALPSNFNPNPGAADLAPGVMVTRNAALSLSARGRVTFSYLGSEAGYTNEFWLDGERFDNKQASNPSFTLDLDAGLAPFAFHTAHPAGTVANGASSGFYQSIALFQKSPTTVFALFNDASTSDKDYDDMVVRMDVAPVPLPAAAWLILAGMAGLGAVARRRAAA